MMDPASLCLPYYTHILEFLYYLYRASESINLPNRANFMSRQTCILLRFSLGWLFELPHFPKHLYFHWQSNYNNQKLKLLGFPEDESFAASTVLESPRNTFILDKLDIIDDKALYSCCPYLLELKRLLLSGNFNNNITNRHIKPVSSELQRSTKTSVKNVEVTFAMKKLNNFSITLKIDAILFIISAISRTSIFPWTARLDEKNGRFYF